MAISLVAGANASAHADSSRDSGIKAPKASVVAIMGDSGQALLWDGKRREYVVVRQGDRFREYRVTSIDAEQVVLTRRGSNQHFVLPRTSDTSDLAKGKRAATSSANTGTHGRGGELLDPYPAPTPIPAPNGDGELGVLDPYAVSGPVTTVTAPRTTTVMAPRKHSKSSDAMPADVPIDPYAASSKPTDTSSDAPLDPYASSRPTDTSSDAPLDPYASSRPTDTPLDPYADSGRKAKPKKGKTRKQRHRISRREFDAAVTDFHALSKEVQFEIIPEGVKITGISRGSVFYRWGFRDRDIILDVDGKRIRGVDDAAGVYAHLMEARRFKVKVQRGVDTVVMHYRFKK